MELPDHRIEFIIHDDPNSSSRRVLVPNIDSQDLRDLLRPIEVEAGAGEIAASYGGIPLTGAQSLRHLYMGHPAADLFKGRITVLGCACGIVQCWPLKVEITVDLDLVVWRSFNQPFRSWSYETLGPFRFDRQEYELGLEHVRAELERDGIRGWRRPGGRGTTRR